MAGISLLFFACWPHATEAASIDEVREIAASETLSGQNSSKFQSDSTLNNSKMDADLWLLHAEQWDVSHHGESILSLSVLNHVINQWLLNKNQKIAIQYPGGEEGEFWVQQLSDWLVSLGIPSARLVLAPGSGADDIIKFDLIR